MREPIYGLSLRLTSVWQPRYQILYRVHAHRKGWSPWCKDGMQVFQENQPVNAVQIELRDRKESV